MRTLIMDGQWGSSGKGSIAGKLAIDDRPDAIVCNFGPNAGHTFIHNGRKIMTQQLPSGIAHTGATILLGPGAIINPHILHKELELYSDLGVAGRLMIHPRAAVVMQKDLDAEAGWRNIGSTRKGVGSALARKIQRQPDVAPLIARDCKDLDEWTVTQEEFEREAWGPNVQIESAQGFELSINHGNAYPQCTSRDITPGAIMNDCSIPAHFLADTRVIVAIRTYPIRVGNEFDSDGIMLGHSGPVYHDMKELTWEDFPPGVEERTTVTGKVRRVFTFSKSQTMRMLRHVGRCEIFLNFCNYIPGDPVDWICDLHDFAAMRGGKIRYLGWGPNYEDVNTWTDDPRMRQAV